MRAILLRHAKSDPHHRGDDHDRPLAPRGEAAAPIMGRWIAQFGPLDRILVSDAARARQTWERLGLPGTPRMRPDLYLAPASQYLHAMPFEGTVLMIGHNDGIGEAAGRLVAAPPGHAAFVRYPTGACTVIDWDGPPGWRTGRVAGFAVPRDFA